MSAYTRFLADGSVVIGHAKWLSSPADMLNASEDTCEDMQPISQL